MISGSIRLKLSLLIAALLIITTLVFSFGTMKAMNRYILDEVMKRAESLGKSSAALAAYSMLSGDLLGIDHIVSKIKSTNPDIECVALVGNDGRVLAHSDIEKRGARLKPAAGPVLKEGKDGTVLKEADGPGKYLFDISTPIIFNGKRIGTMVIRINKSALLGAQLDIRKRIMIGLAVSLLLGGICVMFLSSFIAKPIKALSAGVDELRKGTEFRSLKVYSQDELGSLTESFNRMAATITDQRTRLGEYARDLQEAYISTIRVLAAAIDARDPYTHGHSTRVAAIAVKLGEALGLSGEELEDLEVASLFHDVGKLKTPDFILHKEGAHDDTEYREMMRHPVDGAEILRTASLLHKYIPAVKHHHEWYNGMGYPDGLKGDKIPLFAAIIAIADAFDAMTSTRPYRKALSKEIALGELSLRSGQQFNPALVGVFLEITDGILLPQDASCSSGGIPYE